MRAWGGSRRSIAAAIVDLPLPLSPMSPITSPRSTSKETEFRAWAGP
jgi:hypothetical protein